MPPGVARKVRSAMYWIREPRRLVMEGHRNDALQVYAGYWNAFESLGVAAYNRRTDGLSAGAAWADESVKRGHERTALREDFGRAGLNLVPPKA